MKKTFHELCAEAKKNITECTVEDVKKMMDAKEDFYLIDIREDNEFEAAHIKGAKHVGRGILERGRSAILGVDRRVQGSGLRTP